MKSIDKDWSFKDIQNFLRSGTFWAYKGRKYSYYIQMTSHMKVAYRLDNFQVVSMYGMPTVAIDRMGTRYSDYGWAKVNLKHTEPITLEQFEAVRLVCEKSS